MVEYILLVALIALAVIAASPRSLVCPNAGTAGASLLLLALLLVLLLGHRRLLSNARRVPGREDPLLVR